jgi:hypothetical protein
MKFSDHYTNFSARYQALEAQWTEDVHRYSRDPQALEIAMTRSLNYYLPPGDGYLWDYYVFWTPYDDGSVSFEIMKMDMVMTPEEAARQEEYQRSWDLAYTAHLISTGGRW